MKVKNIKAMALALGISVTSLLLSGCLEKEYENSVLFQSILDDTKDNTFLDEILEEEENKEMVTQMFILEKYLVLSEKLHALNLDDFKEENSDSDLEVSDEIEQSIEKLESLDLATRADILKVWEKYIEKLEHLAPTDDEYISIAEVLKNSEDEINEWLYHYGYATTIRMGSLVSKVKLVDAFQLDKSEYKNFSILENPESVHDAFSLVKVKYTDQKSKSEYYYELKPSKDDDDYLTDVLDEYCENKLAQMIYVVDQSKKLDGDKVLSKEGEFPYNQDLNDILKKFTGIIKSGMYANFTVKEGKIIQFPENDEVNGIYQAKTKSLNEH